MRLAAAVKFIFVLIIVISVCGCTGTGSRDKKAVSGDGIVVVTTIHPLADIIREVGGERVTVLCLLPAGASPHTYEPTVEQARLIAGADLFVLVGAGLDDWAAGLSRAAGAGLKVLELAGDILLLDHHGEDCHSEEHHDEGCHEHDAEQCAGGHEDHGGCSGHDHGSLDPHFWLDPLLVRDEICPRVAAALSEIDPGNAAYYAARLETYREELTRLHEEIAAGFSNLQSRSFITFHAAWRYFAHRYGLEEVAVIARFPGQEPSAAWLVELVQLMRHRDIRAVFAEPQFSPALAESIAAESGAPVFIVDPLGGENLPGRETYLDLLRYNARQFREALQK